MFKKLYENGKVVADDFVEKAKGSYEGAYVKQPKPSLYRAVACFDFASLYPSVMRQMEISPETFLEKIDLPPIIGLLTEDSKRDQQIRFNEILEERRKDKSVIVCSTGAVFKKNETPAILKQILNELYGERKKFKARHLFLEIELVKLKKALETK